MNSNMFEQKYRDMQPETEDLLIDGRHLQNGMVVLIEAASIRADMSIVASTILSNPADLNRAKVFNRWCEVSDVKIDNAFGVVSFVATYPDGTKRKRNEPIDLAWFVKLDSLPKEEPSLGDLSMMGDVAEQQNMEDQSDGAMTMSTLPHDRALTVTEDQLYRLGQAVRTIVPEAEFKLQDEVWTLELTVDLNNKSETVEDEKKHHSFIEFHGRVEDIQAADGPLARALRPARYGYIPQKKQQFGN